VNYNSEKRGYIPHPSYYDQWKVSKEEAKYYRKIDESYQELLSEIAVSGGIR